MKLNEFVPHPESGVRVPPTDVVPAGYLDGAERDLIERLGQVHDCSVTSPELPGLMRDWPSLYHLTPYRSTIFDCFGFDRAAGARVLELGAGCGAITRWLGEHCGEVHAIEGNADRARVVQARCAGLDNVSVFAANYSLLEEADAYDIATLIGVLDTATCTTLTRATRAMPRWTTCDRPSRPARRGRPRARHREPARAQVPQRRPRGPLRQALRLDRGLPGPTTSAVAFSARELESLLREAGFGQTEVFLPFPDYKLAATIVNAAAVRDEHNIHSWLQGAAPDRGHPARGRVAFNETLAQREVVRAGLVRELANSFLVLAYRGDAEATDARLGVQRAWVARHYSLDRRPSRASG